MSPGFYRSEKHGIVKVELWQDIQNYGFLMVMWKDGLMLRYSTVQSYKYKLKKVKDEEVALIDWEND